jgi:hypothetical protein
MNVIFRIVNSKAAWRVACKAQNAWYIKNNEAKAGDSEVLTSGSSFNTLVYTHRYANHPSIN